MPTWRAAKRAYSVGRKAYRTFKKGASWAKKQYAPKRAPIKSGTHYRVLHPKGNV